MKGRDDRHGQPREQRHDVLAGFTTKDAEFMLEGDDIELTCIQEVGRMQVVLYSAIVNLKANAGWIVVGVTMVGHRHDTGFHVRACRCDRPLQIGREGADSATSRKRIPDERKTAHLGHARASVEPSGKPAVAR
jgi:hypothetical protein